jgi:superkiller protein 3
MGTPAYMPPEQARGAWGQVDERADVFALGAILCEILTGRPPYSDIDGHEALRRARQGDLSVALGRLGRCGADQALVGLCRECLAPEREGRPRHAGAVAERVAAYQAEVQERLRRVEMERVAAEARAQEELARAAAERRARQRLLALAAAVLLLVAGGAGGFAWQQWRQERADRAVLNGLARAELLQQQARAEPLHAERYQQALEGARSAAALAEGASAEPRRQAEDLVARLEQEEREAAKDRRLLASLLEVRGPHEGPRFSRDDKDQITARAEPTADEQFASAFRAWGLELDATPTAEAAARLKGRPAAVVAEVVAALDEWASERRQQGRPPAEWQRLADLAAALDGETDGKRRELRAMAARGRLPRERALDALSAALRPVPIPLEVPLGADRPRLRRLAGQTDPAAEPVLGLLTLARALRAAGDEVLAERLLRAAVQARPREVVLYHTLGRLRAEQQPPRWAEAVECYQAARVLRPELGMDLAEALRHSGRGAEGLALLGRLVAQAADNPFLLFAQGNALLDQHDADGAIACYRKALALDPGYALVHNNLGNALADKGDRAGALACYRQAVALGPGLAVPRTNLGNAVKDKGDLAGAIRLYKEAVALDPRLALAHYNLGVALRDKGDRDGALACFRTAVALDPRDADAHTLLGVALRDKGDRDGALACFHNALALDPGSARARTNLGNALFENGDLEGAIANHRQAVARAPRYAAAHNNLGTALYARHDRKTAVACFQTAIALDEKFVSAHCNLGRALLEQGDPDGAIACARKAIAIDPRAAAAHACLGSALYAKGDREGAIARLREALRHDPNYAYAHHALGVALYVQGEREQAVTCYREAIRLDPRLAGAHHSLGLALRARGDIDGAIPCYRTAVALDPELAPAHTDLGNALRARGDLAGAVACYEKALALDPQAPAAHGGLGLALLQQGRYAAAERSTRRALDLLREGDPLRPVAVGQLQQCQRMLALEKKLPAVLQGESPADPGEAVTLGWMCQHQKCYAASARLYADAFAASARLAADLNQQHRYNAARSALLASGQGADARRLPDKVVPMFRRWALIWLRDDLKAYQVAAQNNPALKPAIGQRLTHWRGDPDLASVRDDQALHGLPESERAAWQALWRDADQLARRLEKKAE